MFRIGSLELANHLVCAPLAGITDLPFRLLVKRYGCGLVCSEMVSSNGLIRLQAKTLDLLKSAPEEKPLSIQIFGSDPQIMADAARIAVDRGADILDINFGCSVKKILKNGAGSALMADPDKAERILKAVRQAISAPLTIKMRSGWTRTGEQALELARIAEGSGVDAVAVHPRSARDGFSGHADWDVIRRVKETVRIPVIGNGDVVSPEDVLSMQEQTGCDAVMIGRAALSAPWIFGQALTLMQEGQPQEITLDERRKIALDYLDDAVQYMGEMRACRVMRSRLTWFVKGLPGATKFRASITGITSQAQAGEMIDLFFEAAAQGGEAV